MEPSEHSHWLDPPVDESRDHLLGPPGASITLVEYGSYACPYCRAANEEIALLRDRFGERMRYVFRHRPIPGSDIAQRAAELVERAPDAATFWSMHVELMTRSESLSEADLVAAAQEHGLERQAADEGRLRRGARERVEADKAGARASGVLVTPTFFINGRRYDGPWDQHSLADAMLGRLGHKVRSAALDFASWGPSAGLLLLLATLVALALSNSPLASAYEAIWQQEFGFLLGEGAFLMSWQHWINDGLLTVFFLVVGLEIKREFTVGHLATRRAAALPVAAAIGGMLAPALLYLLVLPEGPLARGWGVPMATDTAFAVALIVMLGQRVPIELRVFLTAAAIVDDIGAIVVVALFYSADFQTGYALAALAVLGLLALLNLSGVYRLLPYLLLGLVLWTCVHASGLHATLAGVLLAFFIPTRPPANLRALMTQADLILGAEAQRGREALRHGPSLPALRAIDDIHDRLESPADRLLRSAAAPSSYLVLPIFALANAGVPLTGEVLGGNQALLLAIGLGLVLGKPLGLVAASLLAVRLGIAEKPDAYSWRQLAGAGSLAGIGFTMSLFIAGQAFPAEADFAAAKIAVFGASLLSSLIAVALLWKAEKPA